jgi:hypothetical protein
MDTTFSMSLAPLMLILLGISKGSVSATPVPFNGPTFIQQHFTSNNPDGHSVFEAVFNSGNCNLSIIAIIFNI